MNVNGVPDIGIGLLCWPGNAGWQQGFDNWTQATGFFPTSVLVYAGDFTNFAGVLYYLQNNNVNVWIADPRLTGAAFTDLNGKAWPARPPMIPCIGVSNWMTDEDMTFASIVAGTNDASIAQLVTMWANTGIFKHIQIRIGYEDNFPTTPAGENSSSGSGGQFGGTGAIASSWQYYGGNEATWLPAYVGAWRHFSHVLHTTAASIPGFTVTTIWGPCFINNQTLSPAKMDPDQNTSDGYGFQVDSFGPDEYWGNFWSPTNLMRTGYQNAPIFQMNYPTTNSPSPAAWSEDEGSLYWYGDFTGGTPPNYAGPLPALPGPGNFSGGWGLVDAINLVKNRPNGAPVVPLLFPEHGLLNAELGTPFVTPTGLYYPPYVTWLRSRIQAMQNLGIPFLGVNLWSGNSPAQLTEYGTVFPELTGKVIPPPPPPPPGSSMQNIAVVVTPSPALSKLPYSYVATADGPWSGPGNIQFEQIIPANNNSSTGWVTPPAATVSINGNVATISGLTSGIMDPHTVQVRDTGTGITSPAVTYGVVASETVTVSYTDQSPTVVQRKAAGVTASASSVTATESFTLSINGTVVYTSPALPVGATPVLSVPTPVTETLTVAFSDNSAPIVSTNPAGTTALVEITTP